MLQIRNVKLGKIQQLIEANWNNCLRAVDDMPKLLERCSDTFKDSRGLIIPMVDNDFYDLLNYKSEKNEQAIDNFLQHRFHAIASK